MLRKIIQGNFFRKFLWNFTKKKEYQSRNLFVDLMNKTAKSFGMNNTHYINPSGLCENNKYCMTTARDLCILTYKATLNKRLRRYYAKEYAITRYIPILFSKIVKKKTINATISATSVNDFPIILEKTGGGDGHYALLSAIDFYGNIVVGAIMEALDEEHRFMAMCELITGVEQILMNKKHISNCVVSAKSACAYVVDNECGELRCIYEQNPDCLFPTMSTTKLMTVLIALDYVNDNERTRVTPYDIMGTGYGDFLYLWDQICVRDLIYLCMLPSCCLAANILARLAGAKMLSQY